MWHTRSLEKEILDLGPEHYTVEEYKDCMIKLDRIGRWLGGDAATFSALKKLEPPPQSILDVGCGGGLFAIRMAHTYPKAKVLGIDINPQAIAFAQHKLAMMDNPPKNIAFEWRPDGALSEPDKSFDVVMSTLVCHHLNDQQIVEFLSKARRVAKRKIIINDLHRHPIALALFNIVSPLFFRNRLVLADGQLSIRRAFTRQEWNHYIKQIDDIPFKHAVKWHWAFRWIVELDSKEGE